MNLFELNANTGLPDIDPIVFEIKRFKQLVTRDKSKNKSTSKAELAFIWFYADYKSDFSAEPDEDKKIKEILNIVTLPNEWKLDSVVREAIAFYKHITTTPSTILLEQTKKTIKKLSNHLETIDFTATDKTGKLKYDMKKVVDTTTQIPKLIAVLREIEDKVKEEQDNLEKEIRGDKDLAVWEDGFEFKD